MITKDYQTFKKFGLKTNIIKIKQGLRNKNQLNSMFCMCPSLNLVIVDAVKETAKIFKFENSFQPKKSN